MPRKANNVEEYMESLGSISLPPKEIIKFANYCLGHQHIIDLISRQIEWKSISEEESEENESILSKFAHQYLMDRGRKIKYVTALKQAYLLITLKILKKIESIDDSEAFKYLKKSSFVDFSEK